MRPGYQACENPPKVPRPVADLVWNRSASLSLKGGMLSPALREEVGMSFVVINIVTVPPEFHEEFERRFAQRAGLVEKQPGFEAFELLKPEQGNDFFVYTRWRSREDFDRWVSSEDFRKGHAQHSGQGPVGTASQMRTFQVVMEVGGGAEDR